MILIATAASRMEGFQNDYFYDFDIQMWFVVMISLWPVFAVMIFRCFSYDFDMGQNCDLDVGQKCDFCFFFPAAL